jgi:succinoglycan biosynthesis transport protein ExoP
VNDQNFPDSPAAGENSPLSAPARSTPMRGHAPRQTIFVATEADAALWPGPEERSGGVGLQEILALLRRRRRILAITIVSAMLISLLFLLLSPRVYQATATLQANPVSTESGEGDSSILSAMMGASQGNTVQTQVEILKRDTLKYAAIKRLNRDEQQAARREDNLRIERVGDTNLIDVFASSRSPQTAANIANALCQEYIQLSRTKNQQGTHEATKYVENQRNTVRARLEKVQVALKTFKQQSGVFNLPTESGIMLDQYKRADSALRQAQADKAAAIAQLKGLDATVSSLSPSEVVPTEIVRRPAVESMKMEMTKLEMERIAKLREYKPKSRVIIDIDAQIAAIRERLAREAETEVQGWRNEPNVVRQNAMQDRAKVQEQIWALEAQGHALKNAATEAKLALAKLPDQEYRLSQLTMQLAGLQQTYQMLDQKLQSLRVTEQAHIANAEVVFPADMTQVDLVWPRIPRTLLMGLMGGLLLALALALAVDRLDDRLHSEKEVLLRCALPVLAQVPFLKEKSQQCLYAAAPEAAPLLSKYQMLHTNIEFSAPNQSIRSVVITSSVPEEGKSLAALNLAVAAAQSGENVILVDCDLRRPGLHRLCELPNDIGFSSVAAGRATLADALQDTDVPGLRLLSSGPIPPNPFRLLKSQAAIDCLQQIREQADFVVIDTPPVLVLPDAQVVASLADAVLMVVSSREARQEAVVRTNAALAQTGTPVIGILLNKIEAAFDPHYSYEYSSTPPAANVPKSLSNRMARKTEDA